MRHYFYYDGISSLEFNTCVLNSSQFDSPKRDTEEKKIPGRNGTLTIDNGRWENKEEWYEVLVWGNNEYETRGNMEELRAWLNRTSGYRELKDSLDPDKYYMAKFTEEIKVDKSDHLGICTKLIFNRKPQRFLERGRFPITVTGRTEIWNSTKFEAQPLIRAYGTGSFTISGVTVEITSQDEYTDIDCDLQEAYKDELSEDRNGDITLSNGKFPVLNPEGNEVTISGLSRIEITPRWWTI